MWLSDTALFCSVDERPRAVGSARYTVTVRAGGDLGAQQFAWRLDAPVVSAATNTNGPTTGGGVLTLAGTNFVAKLGAAIDGADAPPRAWSATSASFVASAGVGPDRPMELTLDEAGWEPATVGSGWDFVASRRFAINAERGFFF